LQVHSGKPFDADDAEHMQWIYSEVCSSVMTYNLDSIILFLSNLRFIPIQALKRAELFGISGVTYSLTQVCVLFSVYSPGLRCNFISSLSIPEFNTSLL
jgi:hypothetical protein